MVREMDRVAPSEPNRMPGSSVPESAGGPIALERTSAVLEGTRLAGPLPPSDEDLFLRVAGGEREGLEELIGRYERGLFALLCRLTGGDTQRADDLFQETFLRAIRARKTFEAGKRFRPWLTTIAVNLVRDDARKRQSSLEVSLDAQVGGGQKRPAPPAKLSCPEEAAERGDEAARIGRALERLTEKEREVVLLHFYDALTLAQTAEVLAVPLGTVKSRLHGALARLKVLLDRSDR